MKRRSSEDSWDALNIVTDAAERYLNRSPRLKRLEAERQALLDAIRRAQLMLSVKRLPVGSESASGALTVPRRRGQHHRGSARST
jgi:hypothetical protein